MCLALIFTCIIFSILNFRLLARWLPASMSLLHPKFLKPVTSSSDQIVMSCVLTFPITSPVDTLRLRFLQSSSIDQNRPWCHWSSHHTSPAGWPSLDNQVSFSLVRLNYIFRYELYAFLTQNPHLLCSSCFTPAGITLTIFFFDA